MGGSFTENVTGSGGILFLMGVLDDLMGVFGSIGLRQRWN